MALLEDTLVFYEKRHNPAVNHYSVRIILAFGAMTHPYDSALTFRSRKRDQGGTVYSNIPKKCFSNGVLICAHLHPEIGGGEQQPGQPTNELTIDKEILRSNAEASVA